MSTDMIKAAEALEAAADYIDKMEQEKQSSVAAERRTSVDELADKYAQATGEKMPVGIREKLSTSDKDVVALIKGIVEKQAGSVESLGTASSRPDRQAAPMNVKEAADAADDRFLNWIMS